MNYRVAWWTGDPLWITSFSKELVGQQANLWYFKTLIPKLEFVQISTFWIISTYMPVWVLWSSLSCIQYPNQYVYHNRIHDVEDIRLHWPIFVLPGNVLIRTCPKLSTGSRDAGEPRDCRSFARFWPARWAGTMMSLGCGEWMGFLDGMTGYRWLVVANAGEEWWSCGDDMVIYPLVMTSSLPLNMAIDWFTH